MSSEQPHVKVPSFSTYSNRIIIKTILARPDHGVGLIGQPVIVGGWVKSSREFRKEPPAAAPENRGGPKDVSCVEVLQTKLPFLRAIIKAFGGEQRIRDKLDAIVPRLPPQPSISILSISDGSCPASLQVLVDSSLASPNRVMPTGTCILVEGLMQKPSLQGKESVEVRADKILHIGVVDPGRYPLSKKRLPLESLRDSCQFRPRTTTVASVTRVRSALTQGTHAFFRENEFLHVQMPVITTSDTEGSGKIFQVLTPRRTEQCPNIETIKASIKDKNKQIEELKRSASNDEALVAAVDDLKKTTELLSKMENEEKTRHGKSRGETSRASSSDEFFSKKTYLTPSGRLHLESYASALGNVYTFGPRFRAKRSETKKESAEMSIVEIEMAFSTMEDSMRCAEDFLKFISKWVLENCTEDLKFIAKRIDKLVVERLQLILTSTFERIAYSEAIEVLKKVAGEKFKFESGISLNEEHESYLADEVYKKPIVLYNHPKALAPFYARSNDDGETAATFDVILPKVGAVVRGSQNEERYDILNARMKEFGMAEREYEWYLDLRRHGAVKCSGLGFLFDAMVLYATGLNDVRDAVPFPRSFGKIND
ncbi:asparagine--tRNA ligase, cytoplasmic 2 [Andrographis paniculata]|uniref:asparagine--tRNA ligase, cytoplasmic 2 n=1 Tax=Andrographis paniculata TaxID=175694 RepID=UPI0021E90735|nr:asparagine--tRNA ligase, cytoplasmic 2 [Andrographis paniculata]